MPRSEQAQQFHYKILAFIDGQAEDSSAIESFLREAQDRAFILETSVNGHSHLMDALHLSYEIKNADGKNPSEIAHCLYDLLKNYCTTEEWHKLLLSACRKNFYPLQQTLISKDDSMFYRVIKEYEELLKASKKSSVANQEMVLEKFFKIATELNLEGFNCLHAACRFDDDEVMEAFLDFLSKLYTELPMFPKLQKKLNSTLLDTLLMASMHNVYPWQIVLEQQNSRVLTLLFSRIIQACTPSTIWQFHQALCDMQSNPLNFLMQVAKSGNVDCLQTTFELFTSNHIPKQKYKNILLSLHQTTYSPLHIPLSLENAEIFKIFKHYLIEAFQDDIISKEEVVAVFTINGGLKFPLLHNALLASPEVYQLYMQSIQELIQDGLLSENDWKALLLSKDFNHISLWSFTLSKGATADNLLDYFKKLTTLNLDEFDVRTIADPYAFVFKNIETLMGLGNIELFKLYFDFLIHSAQNYQLSYSVQDLLLDSNGYNPLLVLCQNSNPELLSYFFEKQEEHLNNIPTNLLNQAISYQDGFEEALLNQSGMLDVLLAKLKSRLPRKEYLKLLAPQQASTVTNPLWLIIENEDLNVLRMYLAELSCLKQQGEITKTQIADLFIRSEAFKVAIEQTMREHLKVFFDNELVLSHVQMERILVAVDIAEIFAKQKENINAPILEHYLTFIEHLLELHRLGNFKDNHYLKTAVLPYDSSMGSLLALLLEQGDALLLEEYFNLLSKAIDQKIIDKEALKNYLMTGNESHVTCLSLVIRSKDPELFSCYWNKLTRMNKDFETLNAYISPQNMIQAACYTNSFDMFKLILDGLQAIFKSEPNAFERILSKSNYVMILRGFCKDQFEAQRCRVYITNIHEQLEQQLQYTNQSFFNNKRTTNAQTYENRPRY